MTAPPFAPMWLRDNCHCGQCLDPRNGQKLVSVADVPAGVSVLSAEDGGDVLRVVFGPDGHRGVFPRSLFARPPDDDGRTEDSKELWDTVRPTTVDWPDYLARPAPLLNAVRRTGFGLLRATPTDPGTVLEIVRTFGYVRTTNYGALFDVRVEERPTNLAFTGLSIGPHTDNPYRDPVPTLQLLHCLRNAATGGESGLVDGFRAAALLRDTDLAAFTLLTRTPVSFAWTDGTTYLTARQPMIGVDPLGRIREVRFNNRSLRPVSGTAAEQEAFYRAYRAFDALLRRPGATVTFTLAPGDCVIFDNTRLLHSRTAFTDHGARHLHGCYADLDALQSVPATEE